MKKLTVLLAGLLLVAAASEVSVSDARAQALGFQLIVNKANTTKVLERRFVQDAFLKRVEKWPNGRAVQPVDMTLRSPVRKQFSGTIMKQSPTQVRNYWTRLIFGGREIPPPEVQDDDAVIAWVTKRPGAIGYISIYAESPDVKVVPVK